MKTEEYYGGTYPSPPEPKEKAYIVKASCSCDVEFIVYSENKEEAKEIVMNKDYDDYFYDNYEIEEITNCEAYDEERRRNT